MKQPSRIDWEAIGFELAVAVVLPAIVIGVLFAVTTYWVDLEPAPSHPTAELEISIEDMERIASMFAGEAKRIKDARMDALEARIERLEEGK